MPRASAKLPECVILLHGLARTPASMSRLETALVKAGYQTINVSYPSRKYSVERLANEVIPQAINSCARDTKINFVTHSLGGILVRQYLSQHRLTSLKHVVMLGPPNQGSEVVDVLGDFPGFRFINGPAGLQLGTGAMSLPNQLGPADFSLGIIAGTRSINFILSAILPGANDGKVSVEKTKLGGMTDHLVLPVSHPFMAMNKNVISQVLYYLQHGRFRRDQVKTFSHESNLPTST